MAAVKKRAAGTMELAGLPDIVGAVRQISWARPKASHVNDVPALGTWKKTSGARSWEALPVEEEVLCWAGVAL